MNNNLQLLGEHFIQVGQLLRQWNISERMTPGNFPGTPTAGYRPGGRGTTAAVRARRRTGSRARTGQGGTALAGSTRATR